jgi:hypothetical protein
MLLLLLLYHLALHMFSFQVLALQRCLLALCLLLRQRQLLRLVPRALVLQRLPPRLICWLLRLHAALLLQVHYWSIPALSHRNRRRDVPVSPGILLQTMRPIIMPILPRIHIRISVAASQLFFACGR